MMGTIGFELQVTALPGFHSLYDLCHQMMWLFSGAREHPEDNTAMEKHSAQAMDPTVKSLMHAISTHDEESP